MQSYAQKPRALSAACALLGAIMVLSLSASAATARSQVPPNAPRHDLDQVRPAETSGHGRFVHLTEQDASDRAQLQSPHILLAYVFGVLAAGLLLRRAQATRRRLWRDPSLPVEDTDHLASPPPESWQTPGRAASQRASTARTHFTSGRSRQAEYGRRSGFRPRSTSNIHLRVRSALCLSPSVLLPRLKPGNSTDKRGNALHVVALQNR